MQNIVPVDLTVGAGAEMRRWIGNLSWTRDLTTQIVTMEVHLTKAEGSTLGFYLYWAPGYVIPVEMRPEVDQYPYVDPVTFTIFAADGEGYIYIGNNRTQVDATLRYVTSAPVQEDEVVGTDSFLADINSVIENVGVPVYPGYAATGAALPYVVSRPFLVDPFEGLAINGDAIGYDFSFAVYCCGASVEASFNLALAVMGTLQGARVRGTSLSASMGYNGAEVEGHYESQVTVQINQGGIQ